MATESGFSNQKKLGDSQYKTIHSVGSDRFGIATAQMYLYEISTAPLPIVNVTEDEGLIYIEATAHGASVGDVARLVNGALEAWEYEIVEIVDVDVFAVRHTSNSLPAIADDLRIFRWITATSDADGALTVVQGPLQFMNNGVATDVTYDTVTPSNIIGLPVEIVGAGTTVNLTAGDINVQLSHAGATYDSTRIGDGTNLMAVNASLEAQVRDDDAITELQDIEADVEAMSAKLPATIGQKAMAASLAVAIASDQTLPLPTGAATEAKQDDAITHLAAIETAVELIDNAIGVDGTAKPAGVVVIGGVDGVGDTQELRTTTAGELLVSFGTAGFATETTLDALNDKVNADFGANSGAIRTAAQIGSATGAADFNDGASSAQTLRVSSNLKRNGNDLSYNAGAADANTLRVAVATGAGIATEAKQDSQITELQDIEADLEAMSAKLPATLGQKAMAASLAVVIASDQTSLPVVQGAMTPSYQEITNLTNVAQTFTAPANAKWCKIQADDTNLAVIRVKIGAVATASSGLQFQPGRSEDYQAVGNISVIAETAEVNQKIYVQFGV